MQDSLIKFIPQDNNLAPVGIHALIKSHAGGFDSLPYIKLMNGQCEELKDKALAMRLGEMILKPDNIGLGESALVVIGPWRVKAMTIENNKVTRCDFNLTPNSRYIPEKNDWEFPDGVTPTVKDIGESPSNGSTILNAVGYDLLFYFPEHGIGAILWIKGTALSMSKIFQYAKANLGQPAILEVRKASSAKFEWYLPHLKPIENPPEIEVNPLFMETMKQFLNPGVMSISSEDAPEKPR